jgi:nickel-dependent lactate racemase
MTGQTLQVPWGSESLSLQLPGEWKIQGILEPSGLPPASDPAGEVVRGLLAPVGSPRLVDLVKPEMRVAIVIDDLSRPTPVGIILPQVLKQLVSGGLARSHITLVPALGVHRPMTEEEIAFRAGSPAMEGIQWHNPDCDDASTMVNLGTTSRGTPVWIEKTVAEADLVVSIGCIEPHIIASYGGGFKNLVPGVAGRETIAHNHSLNCSTATFNMVGQPIDRNPMRLDLEEAAGMVRGRVFIVNAILDHHQRLVRIVAGGPCSAHREGVLTSSGIYGVSIERPADVVISDSNPMNTDLRQGVKALANTIRAVKPGGVLITLVRAEEGVGVFGLANRKLPVGRGALKVLAPLLVRVVPRLKLKGMGEEDRFFLYFALQAMRHARLLMYGPTIPAQTQERLPFVEFVESPKGAISIARQKFPQRASLLVFPHGGITYPVLKS